MTRPALGVDLDNVIAQTDRKVREIVRQLFDIRLRRQDIKEYAYHKCGITERQENRVFDVFNSGACSDLVLVPGARNAIERLRRAYRVLIVTSRHPSTDAFTGEWLIRKRIPFDELIFATKKQAIDRDLDYAVEDCWEYAVELAKHGVKVFLYSYPWNRNKGDHPRIRVVRSWREIVQHLLEPGRASDD